VLGNRPDSRPEQHRAGGPRYIGAFKQYMDEGLERWASAGHDGLEFK
jgi:hypothetical protein